MKHIFLYLEYKTNDIGTELEPEWAEIEKKLGRSQN